MDVKSFIFPERITIMRRFPNGTLSTFSLQLGSHWTHSIRYFSIAGSQYYNGAFL